MIPIKYIIGDATQPVGEGVKIIAHCCNNVGVWGAGFVLAISARWKTPEEAFRAASPLGLGDVQLVVVDPRIVVANLVGQDGVGRDRTGNPPVNYPAVSLGLSKLAEIAKATKATIHMPRMGCGLAGGQWAIIEAIIVETLCAIDVPVFVYDLPSPKSTGGRN